METRPMSSQKGEMASSQMFMYVEPTQLITRSGFRGAFWGDVEPEPINKLLVRGIEQNVQVFGFQALRTTEAGPAAIDLHKESVQTELTYPIQGEMDMVIRTPHENDVVSHMSGVVPAGVDLHGAQFQINGDGELVVHLTNGVEYVTVPTVTPVGSYHGTTPQTDECVYLAVKVIQ